MQFDYTKEPGKQLKNNFINSELNPLVSIITPYYNAGQFFEQTFNCVINQSFIWFEWIIVNDGSTDSNSIQLLEELGGKDSRIKIYHKTNGGISSARNMGIRNSRTEFIVPLDADDLISPSYLELNYWALYFNQCATWSYTDCVGFQGQEYLWKKNFSVEVMKVDNQLTCTAMIRKAELDLIGYYEELEKHYNEDWLLWLKFLKLNKYPVHINEYAFWYRRQDAGVLSIVKSDETVCHRSLKIITDFAKTIETNISAIEYPLNHNKSTFQTPHLSQWIESNDSGKKNILMIIPWMEMGGADLFNLDIVKRINHEKFHLCIVTTIPAQNLIQEQFKEFTDDIFNLPNFLNSENYGEFISYIIKSRNIETVFVSNSYYGYYLIPWLRMNFGSLAIIDCLHMEEWNWKNGGYGRLAKVFEQCTDKTLVSNMYLANTLEERLRCNANHFQVLYTGIDEKKFDSNLIEYGQVRKMYNINEDEKLILYVCRIHPQKRPFLMLEIAKRICKMHNHIKFMVVGDGPNFNELQQSVQCNQLSEKIIFAGVQKDLRPFYRDSDLMLLCSIKEGISITTFEALSMGLPIVSADVGGQGELVDNTVGRLLPCYQNEQTEYDNRDFSNDEINLYVSAIEKLLFDTQEYNNVKQNCREKITQKYTSDIMIKNLEKLFLELNDDSKMSKYRKDLSENLKSVSNIIDDYVTIFNELNISESISDAIWNGKVYHENKSNSYMREKDEMEFKYKLVSEELNNVYNSNSWKLSRNVIKILQLLHLKKS